MIITVVAFYLLRRRNPYISAGSASLLLLVPA